MEILGQRDTRWKSKTIGKSTSTIGGYGCTLTCLAMLAGTTPDVVNDKLTAVNGFEVDRIIWTAINKTNLPIRFPDMGRAYAYDNDKVKQAIEKNGGCLVEVDFDGVVNTPNDRHWILFVGNGKAYDPWTGTEIATTKYSLLKGYCIINKIEIADTSDDTNMTDTEKRILEVIKTSGLTEGDIRWVADLKAKGTVANLEKQVSDYQNSTISIKNTENTINFADNKANSSVKVVAELVVNGEISKSTKKDFYNSADIPVSEATTELVTQVNKVQKFLDTIKNLFKI